MGLKSRGTDLHRSLGLLFVAGLAVRLAWMILEPATGPVADERTWLSTAVGGLAGRAHFDPLRWTQLFYPPLFPYLIAIGHVLGGMVLVTLLQALASSLLILPVGLIGDRLFGERPGTVAAAFAAFYPEFIWHSVHFWAEPLYITLLFWGFERGLAAADSGRSRTALAAGFLIGLATLTREPALYFAPLFALWLAWSGPRPGRLRVAAVFLATTVVTIAPWTVRNWLVYRSFVPVSIMSGRTLWEGNTTLTHDQVFRRYRAIRGPKAVMRQYRVAVDRALENIAARQPWWFVEKVGEQMPRFWAADNLALIHMERGAYGPVSPWSLRLAGAVTLVPYLALVAFFAAGVCVLRWRRGLVLLLAFVFYYCLVHVVVHGHPRFRLPVTPILMLVAAAFLCGGGEVRVPWSLPRGLAALLLSVTLGATLQPSLRQTYAKPAWGFVRAPYDRARSGEACEARWLVSAAQAPPATDAALDPMSWR